MDKPFEDQKLAHGQAVIVELLSKYETAAEIKQALTDSDLPDDLRLWLDRADPDMLETAAILTKKWGSKNVAHGVGSSAARQP